MPWLRERESDVFTNRKSERAVERVAQLLSHYGTEVPKKGKIELDRGRSCEKRMARERE